ncbi:cation-transporting P-type ATPase, partial [Halorubrum tibetense]
MPAPQTTISPYALSTTQALAQIASRETGLDAADAQQRLQEYGLNQLPMRAERSAWKRFIAQFHNVLIYVLFASACASLLLGHLVDAGVILAVIVVNGIVGFVQEGKAEQALRAIMSMSKIRCNVIRANSNLSIDSTQLVPGDIIF